MLRLTVELVPFGIESAKSTITTMTIANTGRTNEDDSRFYNYTAKLNEKPSAFSEGFDDVEVSVTDFNRFQSSWKLVHEILDKIYGEKHGS